MKFMTVTSSEMTSKEDSIDWCEDAPSSTNWNPNCFDKVLYTLHSPSNRCNLEPGDALNLCLVFFKENQEVYESFHCRMKLGWIHSGGIAIDERLYFNHCGGRNIPSYFLHFGFHTFDIFPFLNEAECKNESFKVPQILSSATNLSSLGKLPSTEDSNENSARTQTLHTGMLTPVCVMEKGMKNPSHCQIPFEVWRAQGLQDRCPPTECMIAGFNSSKMYDCIPFIEERTCKSRHMIEGAVCWLNKTDQSYDMCKAITPHDMIRKIRDPHFHELSARCYYHLHPERQGQLTPQDLDDLFFIPLNSMPLSPLIESTCLETYKYMLPSIVENPHGTFWVKEIGVKETKKILVNITIGFICLGVIGCALNIFLVLQMLRNAYTIVVVDIYIVFIVIVLILGLITEIVHVVLANQESISNCSKEYFMAWMAWLKDTVYVYFIALCYDRTYAIARPLLARSKLTLKRARVICISITVSTFAFKVLQSVTIELEAYFYQTERCGLYPDRIWYKSPRYIWVIIVCIAYVLGWLFLLLINIVLVYNLFVNARKWKREVPCHQVASIVGVSICHLIFSLLSINSRGIGPFVKHLIMYRLISGSASSLSILLKLTEVEKYAVISAGINSIEHLMVGLFLLGFTPKYKDMIVNLCQCCKKPEDMNTVQRRGQQMDAHQIECDEEFVKDSETPRNQTRRISDDPPDLSDTDQIDNDRPVLTGTVFLLI